jgi:hypothetical protein
LQFPLWLLILQIPSLVCRKFATKIKNKWVIQEKQWQIK